MGNWNYTGKILAKELDKEIVRKGGLQQINTPVLKCQLELQSIELGGYPSLVHYNKERERQHTKNKENKRKRSLKRQLKRISYRSTGQELPSPEIYLDKEGGCIK